MRSNVDVPSGRDFTVSQLVAIDIEFRSMFCHVCCVCATGTTRQLQLTANFVNKLELRY